MPLIDLEQKKNWTVEPLSRAAAYDNRDKKPKSLIDTFKLGFDQFPDSLAGVFLFINAFLGWALWSFTAAAVTGLLRRSTDTD